MPIVTQSRILPRTKSKGRHFLDNVLQSTELIDFGLDGEQVTTSFRGSREEDYNSLSGQALRENLVNEYKLRFDTGNEFYTRRIEMDWQRHPALVRSFINPDNGIRSTAVFDGDWFPILSGGPLAWYPVGYEPSTSAINADGRKLISMTVPSSSEANFAVFLGELREKFPHIIGQSFVRRGFTKESLGDEHLNMEFGLKPLRSDVEDFARAVADIHRTVKQYASDSGKVVRRKAHLAEKKLDVRVRLETPFLYIPRRNASDMISYFLTVPSGEVHPVDDFVTQNVWFSGAYSYHLAEAQSFLKKIEDYDAKVNHLLGTNITLDTIYQLTPWSWLVDWVSDFGTFVKNVSLLSTDSTVLRYGYVMHETRAIRRKTVLGIRPNYVNANGGMDTVNWRGFIPPDTSSFVTCVTKRRTRATPYGFGLDTSGFTSRQWAILGALGLTRSPNSLRHRR